MDILTHLLELIVHLDQHLGDLVRSYGLWIYGIIFLIIFCETGLIIAPFLPGDSLLFVAGGLWAASDMNPHVLSAVIVAAACCGDNLNYSVGRFLGLRVLRGKGRFFNREALDRTRGFYARHGGKTVIMARFIPIIRSFAPFVAGVGRMHYGRYLVFSVLASLLWVGILVYAGVYFGNVPVVRNNFSLVILLVIGVSFIPVVVAALRRRR